MLTAHAVPGKPKAAALCAAFIAGAPKTAVGHVFYGVNDTNAHAWKKVMGSNNPRLPVVREILFGEGASE